MKLKLIILILLFLVPIKIMAYEIPIYESETNNTINTATLLPYNWTIKKGNISSLSDIDWYKFSIDEASSLTIQFNHLGDNYQYNLFLVKVYNSDSILLSQTSIYAPDELTLFDVGLSESGDYYISVETACERESGRCEYHLSDEYQMTVSVFDTDDYFRETEPNSTISSADDYFNGGIVTGQISTNSDSDYYKMVIKGAADININFYHIGDNYQYNLFYIDITDSSGTIINSTAIYAPDDNTKLGFSVETAGNYYIKVTGCESSSRCDIHGTDQYEIKTLISPLFVDVDVDGVDNRIVMSLEEPAANSTMSGVGNLRGWAVGPDGIDYVEFYMDGVLKKEIPYSGARGDVENAYPGFPDSLYSGFSSAYSYGLLAPGTHVLKVRAVSSTGKYKEASNTFEVTRFHKGFFPDPNAMDISSSSCSQDGTGYLLDNIKVEGIPYNARLKWQVPSQQFGIVEITAE